MKPMWITQGEEIRWEGGLVQVNSQHDDLQVQEEEHAIRIRHPRYGNSDIVTVYKPRRAFGYVKGAEINWCACGSVTPAETVIFMRVLQYAVELASEITVLAEE